MNCREPNIDCGTQLYSHIHECGSQLSCCTSLRVEISFQDLFYVGKAANKISGQEQMSVVVPIQEPRV